MKARITVIVCSTALLVSALAASQAAAKITYDFSFGSPGTGGGQFYPKAFPTDDSSGPSDVAVNNVTGDIYVADSWANRISQFGPTGTFIRTWGRDVDATAPGTGFEICTAASGHTCQVGKAGGGGGEFNEPWRIAVDSSLGPAQGSVYVSDAAKNHRMQRFSANGEFILMWGKAVDQTTGGNVCTAASGDTCVSGGSTGDVFANPKIPSEPGTLSPPGAAQDVSVGADGSVYWTDFYGSPVGRVQKMNYAGQFISQIASTQELKGPINVAASPTGDVWVHECGPATADECTAGTLKYKQDAFSLTGADARNEFNDLPRTPGYEKEQGTIGIDPANGFLFTIGRASDCKVGATGDAIFEYEPSARQIDCLAPGLNIEQFDVSLDHHLYAVDNDEGEVHVFKVPAAEPPTVGDERPAEITSDKVTIKANVTPNLEDTTFHVEYGTAPCSSNPCKSSPESTSLLAGVKPIPVTGLVTGLAPGTRYYYRVVGTNGSGSTAGGDFSFITFKSQSLGNPCDNNLARQQTGATFLLDCRAYELVSAEDQGGYNVESDLIPGGEPFEGFPDANGKALYAVQDGGIPNSGKPTNRGPDPYVATRDEAHLRWNTRYIGVPADAPSSQPFSSTLAGADAGLGVFAFGGPELCSPCFDDGSSGMPLRTGNGNLIQGMTGSLPVPVPVPAGEVRKPLSSDGSHFVFGSEQLFEPTGNDETGDVTIYVRDLATDSTEVASTMPDGSTIADGDKVAALDISEDGSRVLIGHLVGEEAGDKRWHLYMHLAGQSESVDLMPGPGAGATYNGMTSDGSIIYYSTRDTPTTTENQDGDSSVDIFRAQIESGAATVSRVTTGTSAGNTDSCNPSGNSQNSANWNTRPGGPTDCSVVAIGGGGGVARDNGVLYFLSPEQLDGGGVAGSPNLYRIAPGGDPEFVTTLESSATAPLAPPSPSFSRHVGPFTKPVGAAIDHQDGSFYVYDVGTAGGFGGPGAYVQKFDSSGDPINTYGASSKNDGSGSGEAFQSVGDASTIEGFTGSSLGGGAVPTQIAVDNAPGSPSQGDLYVISTNGLGGFFVRKFSASGTYLSTVAVPAGFMFPGAVAVNPTNGDLYAGVIGLFGPSEVRVFSALGVEKTSFVVTGQPRGLAADSSGNLYVATGADTRTYSTTGTSIGILDPNAASGVAVDQTDDRIYVDQGDKVAIYSGTTKTGTTGEGVLSKSINLAVDGVSAVVSNPGGGNVALFAPKTPPNKAYDNPMVVNGVDRAEARRTADFQVNSGGGAASWPSTLALTGFDNDGFSEMFGFAADTGQIHCLSCNPTDTPPTSDARLPNGGLAVTDDGRFFFNTAEPLVLRDTNAVLDAYEWHDGAVQLISTGKSQFDSDLLTVTTDGVDAFFFTHDTLTGNDSNGTVMKLYDARENGGFFVVPPLPECKASDECHGAGSQAAPPASIATLDPEGGNAADEAAGCDASKLSRRAKKLERRASTLRRRAAKADGDRATALRAAAQKIGKEAAQAADTAKKCRAARRAK